MAGNIESPIMELKNAVVGYGKKVVLEPLNLNIPRGRITTLIGPNGAGKSTILKSLMREIPVIEGEIKMNGKPLDSYTNRDLAKSMAAVLTDRVHPELYTCRDVVAAGRYPYTGAFGMLREEDEVIIERSMREVHAEEISEQPFDQVSDGQKQRILLARALCQQPDLLILDEPTSYLDIKYKLDLLSVLRRTVRERKMTVVMSLHEIDLAQKISDLVLCIGERRLWLQGAPEDVFRDSTIAELYGLEHGHYDALFGSVEFTSGRENSSEPEVVVLAMGGSGIPVYRKLRRLNIPFSAGIIPENDVDFHAAKVMAREVVPVSPFQIPGDSDLSKIQKRIEASSMVIIPKEMRENAALKNLIQRSDDLGKSVTPDEYFQKLESEGQAE